MRLLSALTLLVLGACASPVPRDYSGKARFTAYPEALIAAFESSCAGPAQSFARPAPDVVECREFLPPEPTAAIILNFDGTPEALPQLVIRFRTRPDTPGYLVENEIFLNVPQKSGAPLQLRQHDPRIARTLDALYERAGGIPE